MRESEIMTQIQIHLSRLFPMKLWRNNVGQLKNERGQYVRYGLCEGSSDLIGYVSLNITPDMVGKRIACFTAIEVKTDTGKLTLDQERFLSVVRADGGIAFVARSKDEAAECINGEVINGVS